MVINRYPQQKSKMNHLRSYHIGSLLACMLCFSSCGSSIPKGATAVSPFNKERYLGKWYEIARFDFRFERDLNNTTATYSVNADGTIKVDNRGYNYVTNEWKQAIGKAKFAGDETTAMLKVSFFGPFYAGYNVIALDSEYKYALIAGASLDYLWILSRETTIPDSIKQSYLKIAQEVGYNTAELIWVEHDKVGQEPF
jgi:apolipoprotein D and lipocalin family protein